MPGVEKRVQGRSYLKVRTIRRLLICTALFCELALVLAIEAKSPLATGEGGAVATISDEATHAAMEILNAGGNAIDASIAAAATLGVTDPFSCGIGGGGFMLIYLAEDHSVAALDFRETVPAGATSSLFLRPDGSPLSFEEAVASGRSVGVPGTVRGWHEALSRYGTAAPRMSQRNAEFTEIESTIPFSGTPPAAALEALGHRWKDVREIGAANGIEFHADGTVTAVSEPVRHGIGSALVQVPAP